MKKTTTSVALLRGINVGGKNILPMKDLVAMFEHAGCKDVRTYIQSGNVLFHCAPSLAARLPAVIQQAVADQAGLRVPVILRRADELRRVVDDNPYARDAASVHVAFLADAPTAARVATLDLQRSPPDRFTVLGREIYLHCPNGVGKSKLTNQYFDSKLATTSTLRNWKTVLKLLELSNG